MGLEARSSASADGEPREASRLELPRESAPECADEAALPVSTPLAPPAEEAGGIEPEAKLSADDDEDGMSGSGAAGRRAGIIESSGCGGCICCC